METRALDHHWVLAVLAAAWWGASRAKPDAGPLAVGASGGGLSFGPVQPGQWAVTTVFTNRLAGHAPVVIDSVSPATAGVRPGVAFRYATLTEGEHGAPGFARSWPPGGGAIRPLRGAVVRPGQRAVILVGVAARHLGYWRIPAFTVRYHVGAGRLR